MIKDKKYFLKILESYSERLRLIDVSVQGISRPLNHLKEDIDLTSQNLESEIETEEKAKEIRG